MRETEPYSLETQLRQRNINPESYSWFGGDYSEYQRLEAGTSGAAQRVYGAQVTSPHGRGAGSEGTPVSEIWMTAALLNMLTQMPGVTVFHRLRAPGTPRITLNTRFPIEHAVLHGSTVYLIDPTIIYWKSLSLEWVQKPNGRYGIGHPPRWSHNHEGLVDGARRFAAVPGVERVVPLFVMYNRDEPIPAEVRWSPQGVGLFTPNEMMEFVGSDIRDSLPSWRDDPQLREAMIDLRERSLFTFN
jgi:hypothetical protein